MMSQNAKKHVDACRFCWMCRHLCPVGLATGMEVNTPRAKGLLLSMVERGTIYDKDIAKTMYNCLLCGSCVNDCVTGFEPPLFIREARTVAVVDELVPESVQKIIDRVLNSGNIYGEEKPLYSGTDEKADVLLYIGEVAACRQPSMAYAVMSLMKKAGIAFSILTEEPPTGTFLGDLIGFVEEVRHQAQMCADAINASGAMTIVVLDSYDAVTMKQRYPEWNCEINAEIFTATSYISKLIEEGKLVPNKVKGITTYHDDSRLARDLDEHEPARNIIRALGFELHEMFLNRRMAKCCGSALLMEYAPETALLTAEGRWHDANMSNVDSMIVATPEAFHVLNAKVPEGKVLMDLFTLVDQACQ